jgi:twitching motility protein PilT
LQEKLFQKILEYGLELKASDIQLKVNYPPFYRIGPVFTSLPEIILTAKDIWDFVKEVSSPVQIDLLRKNFTVELSFFMKDVSRFRINIFLESSNPAMVIRSIPLNPPDPRALGIPLAVQRLFQNDKGLIILAGPAGSGKSTSAASLLLSTTENKFKRIITIESPIEFVLEGDKSDFIQREIESDVVDYKSGLKAALRQDCDIIFIGEIRDSETMKIALNAAETGHLVVTTMSTGSVKSTLNAIAGFFTGDQLNFGLEQLANALRGIVCQRLLSTFSKSAQGLHVPAFEILTSDDAVKSIIRAGDFLQITNAMEHSSTAGMLTFEKDASRLLREKLVTPEAALLVVEDKDSFKKRHQSEFKQD